MSSSTGDVFERKIDEIFKGLQNVFGTVDIILIEGYNDNGVVHNKTQCRMLQIF